ncbi:hypothetical protein CCMA1212_006755 [Trichoderma ghanense]|uniref:Uncharacterized protein n=1 Tax=Trichoderma ghanense TaxID=65468 RepID=A0ABY2H043_9HYPO
MRGGLWMATANRSRYRGPQAEPLQWRPRGCRGSPGGAGRPAQFLPRTPPSPVFTALWGWEHVQVTDT